jgi:hypothetical protein
MGMDVYAAIKNVPDYHSGHGVLAGVAANLELAVKILYPEQQYEFRPSPSRENVWIGPDGFGEIHKLKLQE